MAKVVQLIYAEERIGMGQEDDPYRLVPQLFTMEGELVAQGSTTERVIATSELQESGHRFMEIGEPSYWTGKVE